MNGKTHLAESLVVMGYRKYIELCSAISLMVCCLGCTPAHEKLVHFILPDDFRGPIILVYDKEGVALTDVDRVCTIRVPSSGELVISDDAPLREFRQRKATFTNGQELPIFDLKDNELAFRGGQYNQRRNEPPKMTYFVGTQQEFEAYSIKSHQQ